MSKREKRRIDGIVRKAERVIGASQPSVDSVYLDLVGGKLEMVWSDNSHPFYGQLRSQLIPRGSGRLGLPYAGTNVLLLLSSLVRKRMWDTWICGTALWGTKTCTCEMACI